VSAGARLILICGLPGSGKTTLAKRLERAVPAVRLCPDEWLADLGIDLFDERVRHRLEQRFRAHAWDLLGLGRPVILEFGFWARAERDEMRLAARALGVPVELHHLTATVDELTHRVDARNRRDDPAAAPLTRELIEEYAAVFEAPDDTELALFDPPAPDRH
jgi:predicted kinase